MSISTATIGRLAGLDWRNNELATTRSWQKGMALLSSGITDSAGLVG